MKSRWLVLLLLLVPMLLVGLPLALRHVRSEQLVPGLDAADVARIEIARGCEQVVLARRMDTGAWELLSAADAPGDPARIAATLERLEALRGVPAASPSAKSRREPLELRLSDRRGEVLGHVAFWAGTARQLPDGPLLAVEETPALPLWPSAWSVLRPPRIAAADVAQVARLTPAGSEPLPDAAAARVARMLERLSPGDFQPGTAVNWSGARQVRVTLVDGSAVDLQQVADGSGRFHLRLASDRRQDVRAARRFAFRVDEPLP